MKQRTAVQTPKETITLPKRGLPKRAAVRAIPEHERASNVSAETRFGHDFSQALARPSAPMVGQNYATSACPVFPRRCPFGGACHVCPPKVQTKLKVGLPGDKYEQEADSVAEQAMHMPEQQATQKAEVSRWGRVSHKDFQRSATHQTTPSPVPPIVHEVLRSPGQPLDPATRAFMEPRFGHDFSGVRVHKDAHAAASARSLHASAYTVGNDIVFASGAYAPFSAEGTRLLAHELSHVVQQDRNGKSIQCWGDGIHKEVTATASDLLTDEDVIPVAAGKSEFVAELQPYSISTDYKARRLMWTGPVFLSGAVEGEGPDHGEDGNYQSEDVGAARDQNVTRQRAYIDESVGYYQQFVSSLTRGRQREQGGPAIGRSDLWDVASAPVLGAASGAVAGTLYGVGAARKVSQAVGGGFWGGLLGFLTGLVTVPLGLALGTAAGALGVGAIVSQVKSRPATNAREGVLAALGDACHVAQDRASHWEGVRGYGHTDERTKTGWNPDDKDDNAGLGPNSFGGYAVAIRNTREVFEGWKSRIRQARRSSSSSGSRPP